MAEQYVQLIRQRRTYYSLSDTSPIPDHQIIQTVQDVMRYSPSSLNGRTSRVVVLLVDAHRKLWDMALNILRCVLPAEKWIIYEKKLNDRKAAYGTLLLYEDRTVLHSLETRVPLFASHINQFSEHNHAILAFNLWTALEMDGFGANLQHFNPYLDATIAAEWKLPPHWTLKAQLVFGTPTAGPDPNKEYGNVAERVLAYGLK
ncbi:hypothetical protein N7530_000809 [Penicillium desertorum]|uniref:Nitroreductase domain-containing protein n=1 Tax=Penicillium desertorum TaxID=1303715 RepID=A0A9X0BVR4_9EURO|nr:hypothetical protein N7530_000809 [Penicillium desertorum]